MIAREENPGAGFTTTPWNSEGIATIESIGSSAQEALEAGLRAVLTLAVPSQTVPEGAGRSAPVNGQGDNIAALFVDMLADLLEQVEFFGSGLQDIAIDGVLRRGDGGYVGWGYVTGTLEQAPPGEIPRLVDPPIVREVGNKGIRLHAVLRRGPSSWGPRGSEH